LLSELARAWELPLEFVVGGLVPLPWEAIVFGFGGPLGPKISAALLRESAVGPSLVVPWPVLLAALVPWAVLLAALVPWPVLLAALVPCVSGVSVTFVLAALLALATYRSPTMARQMRGQTPLWPLSMFEAG
jgi:hypothetical protein